MVPLLIMATSLVSKINTSVAFLKGWVNSFLAFMGQLYIGFYTMVISLHIQRRKPKRTAFEAREIALHEIFIAVGFNGLLQAEMGALMVGGIDTPAKLAHNLLNGFLLPLRGDGEGHFPTDGRHALTIRTHRPLLHVFLD